jgi:hypothetical protein
MIPTRAVIVYQLRRDKQRIEAVQRATAATRKFGVMRTHGLFGSDQWWQKVESGKLPIRTVSGVITRLYMGGMRDTPEFILRSDDGKESSWLRQANSEELDGFYGEGRQIEIDYVLQRHRLFSEGFWPKQHPVVVEIRIGDNAASKQP